MREALIIAAMLAILAASGAYADDLDSIARQPGPLKEDKVVDLREADGGILDQLERAGVIDSASRFAGLVLLEGNSLGKLHYGEYAFRAGEGMLDVERDLIGQRPGHLPPNTLRSRGMRISALKPQRKFGDVDNHLASS